MATKTNLGVRLPPLQTPLLDTNSKISLPWAQYFQALTTAVQEAPTFVTVPVTHSGTGTPGQIAFDDNFIYVCVEANTWKRAAIATF